MMKNNAKEQKLPIRLLLVEDECLVREAIGILLEKEAGLTVIEQADTGAAALQLARQHHPDVILLDLHLSDVAGVELIGELRQQVPTVRILVFSGYAEAHEVIAAFQVGADGYVLKTQMITELVHAIEQTYQGLPVLDPTVAHILLSRLTKHRQRNTTVLLSPSEQQILPLAGQGFSNHEISNQLSLSQSTVRAHISSILHKLCLTNRTQLLLYALQHNWIQLDDLALSANHGLDRPRQLPDKL